LRAGRNRALKITATALTACMLAAFAATAERVRQLDRDLNVIEIDQLMGGHTQPPTRAPTAEPAPFDPFGGRAVNILITGIDSRASKENQAAVGDRQESLLNDVTMVVHLAADRSRVDVMSIPRDTLVPLPECTRPDGSVSPAQREAMINTAFAKGSNYDPEAKAEGMACVVKTVEEVTQIRLDAFVLVDFAGFQNVVDALGGVDICVPDGLVSKKTHLDLAPGLHHLGGQEALAFARTRSGADASGKLLDGSDLTRITRQQQLVSAVINEVMASNGLGSLPKLNTTATAVAQSLHVSTELGSVADLAGLAYALRDVDMANISMFMAPNVPAGYRVRLAEYGLGEKFGGLSAREIFELFALDLPVPGTTPYKAAHPDPASQSPPSSQPASEPAGAADPSQGADPPASEPPAPDEEFTTVLNAPVTCQVPGGSG
jgi:LCP family protein required for cell wall assembly